MVAEFRKRPALRHLTTAIAVALCTLLVLSAVAPLPESIGRGLLSIGTSEVPKAQAQEPVSTNGMAYAEVNKSGCQCHKGNCQIRLDFFLEPEAPRYEDRYLYLVDTTSPAYLAGYPGEVDEEGNPVDQEDYDKWYEGLPRVWQNTPFHTQFVYFASDFTEEDIKAAIELHLPNFYKAFQEYWDEVPGGMRHGWATETRIKPTDYSKTESAAEYDARVSACQLAIDNLTAFSYKPPSEGVEGQTFPSTDIDIGPGAISRTNSFGDVGTIIDLTNPANATGTIDTFEVWALNDMPDTQVGTFYGSGSSYTNRDGATIGTVTAGAKRTFVGLSIDVSTDDYAGIYYSNGDIERTSTTPGLYYKSGNQFGTGLQTGYSYLELKISIYGTGETPAVPEITNSPSSYGFGTLALSSTATTGLDYFTITNTGNCAVDITIQGTDATGGDDTWTLADDGSPGTNIYALKAGLDDGEGVILKEDDFEWGNDGDSLSTSGGDITWSVTAAGTSRAEIDTAQKYAGTRSARLYRDGTNSPYAHFSQAYGEDYIISARMRKDETSMIMLTHGDGTNAIELRINASEQLGYYYGSGPTWVAVETLAKDTWYLIEVKDIHWTAGTYDIYRDGVLKKDDADMRPVNWATNQVRFGNPAGTSEAWVDDVEVISTSDLFDTVVRKSATYNTLVSDLAAAATQDWGLKIWMPTSLSGYDAQQMSATVTLVASASS